MTYIQKVLDANKIFLTAIDTIAEEEMSQLENRVRLLEKSITEIQDRKAELKAETDLMLNVTQMAKTLGVSRPTVYRLIESGALPAKKLATGPDTSPRTVVLAEDLKAFLANLPSANP